jgi:hypothetical protein|tara:strand:+ start:63 stop:251 length:189 start_codon:yes stop_codon:yes gene_type:complete
METKQLLQINMAVFGIVALLHFWRAISGLELNIGAFALPVWASYVAFVFVGWLAYVNKKATA